MNSNRSALITGAVLGLVAGVLISGPLFRGFLWPLRVWSSPTHIHAVSGSLPGGWLYSLVYSLGVPELIIGAVILLFLTFWVAVIIVIVRAMGWMGRDRGYRMEDLPAYFEEWHQRAHAHMRETADASDPDRRG